MGYSYELDADGSASVRLGHAVDHHACIRPIHPYISSTAGED